MMFDADCIEASALYNARREGQLEARRETAKKLLAKDIDINTISETTGLTIDEVLRL
jgi:predicted transposase/invertase (TIGR01784 family)